MNKGLFYTCLGCQTDHSASVTVSLLPSELILYIMGFLSVQDRCRCAQVCKTWNVYIKDKKFWKNILPVQWAQGMFIVQWEFNRKYHGSYLYIFVFRCIFLLVMESATQILLLTCQLFFQKSFHCGFYSCSRWFNHNNLSSTCNISNFSIYIEFVACLKVKHEICILFAQFHHIIHTP